MKKRFLSIVLIGVLSASLCACSKSEPASNKDVTKTTEPTTSVELSKETKITNKMSDSEKITTAFDNTINADNFIMKDIRYGTGDVSTFDPMSDLSSIYEFYKDKNSYIGIETGDYYLYSLSQIDLNNKEEIIDFYKSYGFNEERMDDVIKYCETGEKENEYSAGYDIEDVRNHNYYFCEGIKDNLYYNYNHNKFRVERSKIDVSGYQDEFFDYYNREFSKVLNPIYQEEYGLPYRHFIRAVGMVFDQYPKSKDDFFFVTDFNNEDGVYSFEAYALDLYHYYEANSDYKFPEFSSGLDDIKIGVRYVLDGNYLTEMTTYLLTDNSSRYSAYFGYIFEDINSVKEKDSLACAYFKEIDEKYEPGNYKKAAEIFFGEFDDEDDERFKLGSSDENGVPIIIQYSGSSTSEYAYNGYIYEYVEDSSKDVGRNQLGYYTAKEVLDNMLNGTPLADVPEWKQAYIDYLSSSERSYMDESGTNGGFSLIYIDEDNIPEIFYDSGGFELLTYTDAGVEDTWLPYGGFYYIEKQNQYLSSFGRMGSYGDSICKLKNGISEGISGGEYGDKYDENGNVITEYIWNGSKVSKEEYDQQLEKAFDMSSAKTINDSEKYSKEQIIQKIIDWNDSTPTKQASSQNSSQDPDYILPDCDSRHYTDLELLALSDEQLKLARNEIYARHGYIFQPGNTKNYFDSKSWYRGTVSEVTDDMLNEYEIANRDMIIAIENGTGDVVFTYGDSPKFINNDEFFSSVPEDVVKIFNATVRDNVLETYPDLIFVAYDEDTGHIYGKTDEYYFDFIPINDGYGLTADLKENADWWTFGE